MEEGEQLMNHDQVRYFSHQLRARWQTLLSYIKAGEILKLLIVLLIFNVGSTIISRLHEYSWKPFSKNADISENTTTECNKQLSHYIKHLAEKKEWAMKMFDARGDVPTGLLDGNVYNLGNFDECIKINEVIDNSTTIYGKYCRAKFTFKTLQMSSVTALPESQLELTNITMTLGTCFPSKCSVSKMENVYKKANIQVVIEESSCRSKQGQSSMDTTAVVTIALLGIFLGTVTVATIYNAKNKSLHPILAAFSMLQNWRKCLSTPKNKDLSTHIACLDGVRVISTIMIVYYHVLLSYCRKFEDLSRDMTIMENFFCEIDYNANLSVDTFFLMSGLLVTFNEMKAIPKNKPFSIVRHYVNRYIRLTVLLAVFVLYNISLINYMSNGPFWDIQLKYNKCKSQWWKVLLYVHNYRFPLCVTISWSLGVDMQLFILSPILLIPLRRKPKMVMIFTGFLIIFSIAMSFLTVWTYYNTKYFYYYYYYRTHTRATPWLIGIILGYVIFTSKPRTEQVSACQKMLRSVFWILSSLVLVTCMILGSTLKQYTANHRLGTALNLALIRPIWATACAWIIYACALHRGGPINHFLSLPIFEVLSKFTYTALFVHWEIVRIMDHSMRTYTIEGVFEKLLAFGGCLIFTFTLAPILTLLIEMPMIALAQLIFKKFLK